MARRMMARWRLALIGLGVLLCLQPALAAAAGLRLIRDAEIEATLGMISRPLMEAAGLDPQAVKIYIVIDDELNAFVAGGQNLFLNTGLLIRSEDAGQLAGVIAHELGHIAGGHLSRVGVAQERAATEMILATLLGAAAAVAGAPDLGTAIIFGGQTYAQGSFFSFSRSQEQAADQAAMGYLRQAGLSPAGLAEFFAILENQNVLSVSSTTPYLRTHPLTRDRITFVRNQLQNWPQGAAEPAGWAEAHRRMVAKLEAFLEPPAEVLAALREEDDLAARYARAIADYRLPDLAKAVAEVDALIASQPEDPYFHELKGQMLFENGRIDASIAPYREAVRLQPASALLRIGLAKSLIESGDAAANREAVDQLQAAVQDEADNATAWRLLGIAQGRAGAEGESSLALAEYALLANKKDDARLYARRAERRIEASDPAWLRLQDILRVLDEPE